MSRRPDRRSVEAEQYRRLYGTARWKWTRAQQLASHPLCEACAKLGRVTAATVCNHTDPDSKSDSETFFAGPFSSLCAPCHDQGEQREEKAGYSFAVDSSGWPTDSNHPANAGMANVKPRIGNAKTHPAWFRKAMIPTTLVCGAPGSGKSHYVRTHAGLADRIVCFDTIAVQMFGKPGDHRVISLTPTQVGDVLRQRNELIADLMWSKAKGQWPRAWIILTEPKADHRQWWSDTLGAEVVVMDTPQAECIRRVRAAAHAGDRRSFDVERTIRKWFAANSA